MLTCLDLKISELSIHSRLNLASAGPISHVPHETLQLPNIHRLTRRMNDNEKSKRKQQFKNRIACHTGLALHSPFLAQNPHNGAYTINL